MKKKQQYNNSLNKTIPTQPALIVEPKEQTHKQPKRLRHAKTCWEAMKNLETGRWFKAKVKCKSEYKDYTIPKMTKERCIELYIAHKLEKWERKHPCPVKEDASQEDLFKDEFVMAWKAEKETAAKRIREFVLSVYDKSPVIGYYMNRKGYKMDKKIIGYAKGHLDKTKTSDKTFMSALNIARQAMIRDPKIIDTDVRSHDATFSRPLLQRSEMGIKEAA